jgi:hypothetical protein
MKNIIASVALLLTITASPALAEPVTCEQFFAILGEGLKETCNAPPLTYGKTLAYGEFKDTQVTAFPGVHIGVSCLKGHLDTFQTMPESRDELASLHTGLTAGAALHAFGMDWKAALNLRDRLVSELAKFDRAETTVAGATVRLYHGVSGIPVFEIEYPDKD